MKIRVVIAGLLLALVGWLPAHAQATKASLLTQLNACIVTNTSGLITPQCVNALVAAAIGSMCGLAQAADCPLPTGTLANLGGLPHVANLTALEAYPTTGSPAVVRDGYATAGDGGLAAYTYNVSNCATLGYVNDGGYCANSNTSGAWVLANARGPLNPAIFGAIPNTVELFATVTSTAGNDCVTLGGGSFTSADVGKLIRIESIGANERWFNGSITSVSSATGICLSANASQTVTAYAGQKVFYGSDSTAALNAAMAAGALTGRGERTPTGHYLTSSELFCPIPASGVSYSNNFYEPPSLCPMDDGAQISAMATMTAVIQYGSANSDYTGYVQHATLRGGSFDGGFVAQYGVDVPFFIDLIRKDINTKNTLHSGVHYGSETSPTPSGGPHDLGNFVSRDTSGVPVSTCTSGHATVTCTTTQDHGFCNQGRPRQPVVAIIGAAVAQFSTQWFRVTCPTSTTFTIQGVNGSTWSAWSGAATAFLTMPTMKVPMAITGVSLATAAVVTVADTSDLVTGDQVLIADIAGLTTGTYASATKCLDGVFTITVLSATTFSVPVNTSACSAYSSGGTALYWIAPPSLESAVYFDNVTDADTKFDSGYGIRIGLVANPASAGYDGKYQYHFYNYPQNGELLSGDYLGGDSNIIGAQTDCPARFGHWIFGGQGATISGSEMDCAGFTFDQNNYASYVRRAANSAEGGAAGIVDVVGGSLKGQAGGYVLQVFSSSFPFTSGISADGDVLGFKYQFMTNATAADQVSSIRFFDVGSINFIPETFAFSQKVPGSGKIDAGIQFGAVEQTLGIYTAGSYRGGMGPTGIFTASGGFDVNGTDGFTGTKTAGSCVLTISGGIITSVSGC